MVYAKRAWANDDEARSGDLRLCPAARIHRVLGKDYADMAPMFPGEYSHLDTILARQPELKRKIIESKRIIAIDRIGHSLH